MNTAKCPCCNGKGYKLERITNSHAYNYGEWEKFSCITPCYEGKIRFEKLSDKCDECEGEGRIKYWCDTGSIIPGFRKKTWYEKCRKCLGTGKKLRFYFKCNHCNDGYRRISTQERGLFGWRNVSKKYKCSTCNGLGFALGSYSYSISCK